MLPEYNLSEPEGSAIPDTACKHPLPNQSCRTKQQITYRKQKNHLLMPLERGQKGETVADEPRVQEAAILAVRTVPC